MLRSIFLTLTALFLVGCGGEQTRVPSAPPADRFRLAEIPGFPDARVLFGESLAFDPVRIDAFAANRREGGLDNSAFTILALSGGGPDGAFGAGLLKGWTEHGDRPVFDVVTGISTGALIAPFAFLGPEFDRVLERFYTEVTTEEVIDFAFLGAIFGALSVADSQPLEQILIEEMTPTLVAQIAREHRRGRRLLIGTTYLDAQRPVIWDVGQIAASGHPDAPALIRKIMLASASIPGVFPPVFFDVEAGGARYTELHVDGGVALSVFAYPIGINLGEVLDRLGVPERNRQLYVIRNAKLKPEYAPLDLQLVSVSERSISTLIKSQTVGTLAIMRNVAIRDGFRYNLAFVPDSFSAVPEDFFDPVYMSLLYDVGYKLARAGYDWQPSLQTLLAAD
ncbi:MAG: patatin-like phospholipase family protein [Pseudomonadota bacterium]